MVATRQCQKRCVNTIDNTHHSVYYMFVRRITMKRRDLIKKLEDAGFRFKEHGGNHDIYQRGSDTEVIPRHKEINEITAKGILRKRGLK